MRLALTIAIVLLGTTACRKKEERPAEQSPSGTATPPTTTPSTGEQAALSQPGARATTTPKRGDQRADTMRPESPVTKPVLVDVTKARWGDGPPALPKGVQMSVLEGEPPFATEKTFTVLLRMPRNYTIAPHTHLVTERVTVLEGALSVGHGEKLNRAAATKVTAGGLVLVPARHVHYAFTTDQETTIALTGVGPWEIIYVDPKNDPRPTPARMPEQPAKAKWDAPVDMKIIQAAGVKFEPVPASLMALGARMAVLEGDPSQPQTFTIRLQIPKGFNVPMHSHTYTERIFALSGHARFAVSDTMDEKSMQEMKAPSVAIIPPNTMHYARAESDSVVQIVGIGPFDVNWAKPAQGQEGGAGSARSPSPTTKSPTSTSPTTPSPTPPGGRD